MEKYVSSNSSISSSVTAAQRLFCKIICNFRLELERVQNNLKKYSKFSESAPIMTDSQLTEDLHGIY